MTRLIDFGTAFGKMGSWPGNADPGRAKVAFDIVSALAPGSVVIEVGPFCGRMTGVLGKAARNSGVKTIYCLEEWSAYPQQIRRWFDKAVVLHGLADLIIPVEGTALPEELKDAADAAIVSLEAGRPFASATWVEAVKQRGKIVSCVEVALECLEKVSPNRFAHVYVKRGEPSPRGEEPGPKL